MPFVMTAHRTRSNAEIEKELKHGVGDDAKELRIRFSKLTAKALARAGYKSDRQLHAAIRERKSEFTLDVTARCIAVWQHLYGDDEGRLASIPLCKRLLELVPIFLPAYADLNYLTDPALFAKSVSVSSSSPPELRLPIKTAFEQWLESGRKPKNAEVVRDLAGEYSVYFPWPEAGMASGKIAVGRARISQRADVWTFESRCNPGDVGLLLFAGQLRFTGVRSVVVVGFTSFPPPFGHQPKLAAREQSEMIVHPYRVPKHSAEWWHGTTAFLDVSNLEYVGTVGHVMRRMSTRVPDDEDWAGTLLNATEFLDERSADYSVIASELKRCLL